MPKRHGFTITAVAQTTCCACRREKECYYLTSTDGSFEGAICYPDMRRLLRVHLGNAPIADSVAQPATNGQHTEDLEEARS